MRPLLAMLAASTLFVAAADARPKATRPARAARVQTTPRSFGARGIPAPPPRNPPARTATVTGRALLPDGVPAAGARIFVLSYTPQMETRFTETKSGADGRFRVVARDVAPHMPLVSVSALVAGRAFGVRRVQMQQTYTAVVEMRLRPTSTLTGRVIRSDGQPAAGVKIGVAALRPNLTRRGVPSEEEEEEFAPVGTGEEKLLPAQVVAALYRATTDVTGHFIIAGMPQMGQAVLQPGEGLMLSTGSSAPVELTRSERQDVGTLVAVRPGTLKVRLKDRLTGAPALGVPLLVTGSTGFLTGESGSRRFNTPVTDQQGEASHVYPPGKYLLFVQGARRSVTIADGETTQIDLASRSQPLRGRVVDANGKPVAGAAVSWETPSDAQTNGSPFTSFLGAQGRDLGIVSGPDGTFQHPMFPWLSARAIVRAERGNAGAEWEGSPEAIGNELVLRLRPQALVTVTGRLVHPNGKPLPKASMQLVRWQDAPRINWFTNAEHVLADPQGRFRIEGLRRREAFSVISGGPFGTGRGDSFESPRFETAATGAVQNLGDVVVHPLEGPEQLIQLYGFDSQEQLARATGFLKPQSPEAISAARQALQQWNAAAKAGDVNTLYRLTARASFNWTDDRATFVNQATLRGNPAIESDRLRPLPLAPQFGIAYLLTLRRLQEDPTAFNFGAGLRQLEREPDWLIFAAPHGSGVRTAGVMHREAGEWRVVTLPEQFGEEIALFSGGGGERPDASSFGKAAPAPDAAALAGAKAAGEQFLQAWANGHDARLWSLTSPFAAFSARDIPTLRRQMERRADEGECPLPAGATVSLRPVEGLDAWDIQWVAAFAPFASEISGGSGNPNNPEAAGLNLGEYGKRGDILPLRYAAEGREFLMLLVRHKGQWQVMEPAMPL